jgi:glycosyltransferase involved in cell wall biosynthesis
MRCALIEFNHYHDEVLPTFVWLLNELGIAPDVYVVDRSARRRPFAGFGGLRFRQRTVKRYGRLWRLGFRLRRYEVMIVNSMEPATVLERVAGLDVPLLGVVHNTELLLDDPSYRSFFAAPRRRPLVLGEHIAEVLGGSLGRLAWISHVVFPPDPAASPDADRPTVFVVSGNVEFHRRNYDALLDAVSELVAEDVPFVVRVVGRSTTRDGRVLRREVESRGLAARFEFSPGEIDHPRFFQLVGEADFSLPLIDLTREPFRAYLSTKLASSVPFAIGLGVPLVVHTAVAGTYGVEGTGPTYLDGELADAMRRAIASPAEDRAAWRAALAVKREAILAASRANLREALRAVLPGAEVRSP